MPEQRTIYSVLEECVQQLNEPFRRADITAWFRKNHPELHGPSVSANIQGAVSNITDEARGPFARNKPLITRQRYGVYTRFDPSSPDPKIDKSDPRWALLADAVSAIEAGSWTSYGDLAEVTTFSAQTVGNFLRDKEVPNVHRVLTANGKVADNFAWTDPNRHDNPKDLLVREGVRFDRSGQAAQSQRVSGDELRTLLGIEPEAIPVARRAWLVRGSNVNGRDLVGDWLSKGSCSLAASQLRTIEPPLTRREIAALVEDDYAHVSYNARNEKTVEFDTFLNRIQIDDLVVTTSKGDVFIGTITSEPTYVKSKDDRSNLRRQVEWFNPDTPIDFSDLPSALKARLASQHSVVDLTTDIAAVERLIQPAPVVPQQVEAVLRDATAELAAGLLMDRAWLQECIELLRDRRQIIFYGPPGTGKTYVAQKLAQHITASEPDAVKLVQFHPAYSYEDFFEGYRPKKGDDGQVGFELSPGPFRRLVDAARENPGTAYVLIVDEINRANLAKVFGELYFLLEYRDEPIDLLYASGDDTGFTLPANVYIIGTMNTADRSIALVDAAMRRRFAFVPMHPSEEPTASLLRKWLLERGRPTTYADLLDALNSRIEDDDFKIGPSYFMRDSVYAEGGLERVWRTAIMPLLQEHHYGEHIDVAKRYGLSVLQRSVAPAAAVSEGGTDELADAPEADSDITTGTPASE